MVNTNVPLSKQILQLGVIDPDATPAGTVTTAWVSVKEVNVLLALVMVGTLGSSSTVDAKLEQATDGAGTGAKDVTGKAITQVTQAGTDQSDTQYMIDCQIGDLDIENDFDHVRLSITVGTAASDIGGYLLGMGLINQPADQPATVGEIV